MYGKTRQDKIRNKNIKESFRITPIVLKMVKNRLRWFGHVEKRPVDSVIRRIDQMERSQQLEVEEDLEKLYEKLLKKISRLTSWLEVLSWIEHYGGS